MLTRFAPKKYQSAVPVGSKTDTYKYSLLPPADIGSLLITILYCIIKSIYAGFFFVLIRELHRH